MSSVRGGRGSSGTATGPPSAFGEGHGGACRFEFQEAVPLPYGHDAAGLKPQLRAHGLWNDNATGRINGGLHGIRLPSDSPGVFQKEQARNDGPLDMVVQVILAVVAVLVMLIGILEWRDGGRPLVVVGALLLLPSLLALASALGLELQAGLFATLSLIVAFVATIWLIRRAASRPPEVWLLVAAMGVLALYVIVKPASWVVEMSMATGVVGLWLAFAIMALRRSRFVSRCRRG